MSKQKNNQNPFRQQQQNAANRQSEPQRDYQQQQQPRSSNKQVPHPRDKQDQQHPQR